jgi:hypothetical protein
MYAFSLYNCLHHSQLNYWKYYNFIALNIQLQLVDLGGLVVSMLATGPKVRGFDPDRGRWIFKGDKNP